jgi:choline dehydrogenase
MSAHASEGEAYDFIVVGGGSGGSAVSAALSESGRHRVLLLEAGEDDRWIWLRVPLGAGFVVLSDRSLWRFHTEPEAKLANRRMFWPRGRVLGGSSTVNGMLWVRGEPAEYDHWRALGNRGWGYFDVLPYLKRMEAYQEGDGPRGQGGPIIITRSAASLRRFPRGMRSRCLRRPTTTAANTGRAILSNTGMHAYYGREAYLRPARGDPTCACAPALAHRIRVEKGRAVGVDYCVGDQMYHPRHPGGDPQRRRGAEPATARAVGDRRQGACRNWALRPSPTCRGSAELP